MTTYPLNTCMNHNKYDSLFVCGTCKKGKRKKQQVLCLYDSTQDRTSTTTIMASSSPRTKTSSYYQGMGVHDVDGMPVDRDEIRRYHSQLDGFRAGGRWNDANRLFKTILKRVGGERAERSDSDEHVFDRLARLVGRENESNINQLRYTLESNSSVLSSKFDRIQSLLQPQEQQQRTQTKAKTATDTTATQGTKTNSKEEKQRDPSHKNELSSSKEISVFLNRDEIELFVYLQIVHAELEWRRKEKRSMALVLLSSVLTCSTNTNVSLRADASALVAEILLQPYCEDLVNEVIAQESEKGLRNMDALDPNEESVPKQQKDEIVSSKDKDAASLPAPKARPFSDEGYIQSTIVSHCRAKLRRANIKKHLTLRENSKGDHSVFGGSENDKTGFSLQVLHSLLQTLNEIGDYFGGVDSGTEEMFASDDVSVGTAESEGIEKMRSASVSRRQTAENRTESRHRSKSYSIRSSKFTVAERQTPEGSSSRSKDVKQSASELIDTLLRVCLNSIPCFPTKKATDTLIQVSSYRCLLHIRLHVLFGLLAEICNCTALAIGHYLSSWRLVFTVGTGTSLAHEGGLSSWQHGVQTYESLLNGDYVKASTKHESEQDQLQDIVSSFVRGIDFVALFSYKSSKSCDMRMQGEFHKILEAMQSHYSEEASEKTITQKLLVDTVSSIRDNMRENNGRSWVDFGATASPLPPVVFTEDTVSSLSRSLCAIITASLLRVQSLYLSIGYPYGALHLGIGMLHAENGLASSPPLDSSRLTGLREIVAGGFESSSRQLHPNNHDEVTSWGLSSIMSESQISDAITLTWLSMNTAPKGILAELSAVLPWRSTTSLEDYVNSPGQLNYLSEDQQNQPTYAEKDSANTGMTIRSKFVKDYTPTMFTSGVLTLSCPILLDLHIVAWKAIKITSI